MPHPKLIWFALRELSAMGYYQAGAEMFGGERRRQHAVAHRNLSNAAGSVVRKELLKVLFGISEPARNRP